MNFVVMALSALSGWLWTAMKSKVFWLIVVVVLQDVVFSLVAAVIGMAVAGVNSVGFDLPTLDESIGLLPIEVLNIMKRVGVDDCLALIVSAYTVRSSLRIVGFFTGLKPRT